MSTDQLVWALVGGAILVAAFRVMAELWRALVARLPGARRIARQEEERRAESRAAARAERAATISSWALTLKMLAESETERALRREREQSGMPADEVLWEFFRSRWTQVVREYATSKGWVSVSVHACNQANNEQTIQALGSLMYPVSANRIAHGAIARYREYVAEFGPVGYEDRPGALAGSADDRGLGKSRTRRTS